MQSEQIETWGSAVESLIARERIACIDRIAVVRETESTQDVARAMCGGRAGVVVGSGRELRGVLIEQVDGLALVGVGINVLQRGGDWAEELRLRAVSLGQLGSAVSRLDVLLRLISELDRALGSSDEVLEGRWAARE